MTGEHLDLGSRVNQHLQETLDLSLVSSDAQLTARELDTVLEAKLFYVSAAEIEEF